jgi:2-(3-amino-3-carboxypropyl)histidine synthase
MRILLQFPEGLKQKADELQKKYESEGHEVFLSASPCYGACDIALDEARWIKADKIVHFGHNKFVKTDLPISVEYVPYQIDIDVESLNEMAKHLKGHKTIALTTTVQHVHQLEEMKKVFEKHGIAVLMGSGYWATQPGQVLGCDSLGAKKLDNKIDAVVFVGDGMFHPLGIENAKPIFAFNPYTKQIRHMNEEIEKLRKKRKGSLLAAVEAKHFGIIVSTKIGQFNLMHAEYAKKELEKRGKHASILVANELEPITVNNFRHFDCYVNTACPRIVDDTVEFGKPILNLEMLKELFGILDSLKKGK